MRVSRLIPRSNSGSGLFNIDELRRSTFVL